MKTTTNEVLDQLTLLQAKALDKREALAAQIMAQLVSSAHGTNSPTMIAKQSVIYAEALLKELGARSNVTN